MNTAMNLLSLIGSLGLFLYGMKIMSEGLEKFAGNQMRSILKSMTKNRFFGVLTGIRLCDIHDLTWGEITPTQSGWRVDFTRYHGCKYRYNHYRMGHQCHRI